MKKFIIFVTLIGVACSATRAQDKPDKKDPNIVGEVTVTAEKANSDPVYQEFRNLSENSDSFGGKYAVVKNLVLKRDQGQFTFRSGEIYFLKEAEGKRTGAVFIGDGEFSIAPPNLVEEQMLEFLTKEKVVKEQFDQLVMFFTDDTFSEVERSPNVEMRTNGSNAAKARDEYRSKESLLKTPQFDYNMSTRKLIDTYAPARAGFFWGFINGKKYSKLLFKLDPLGVEEIAPEQLALINYDQDNFGIWLGSHTIPEILNGTGNSNADRRLFDITNHNIDVTIKGTRLIISDEVELFVTAKGQRVLPFNLFRSMRVKRILNQDGEVVSFIQEDKEKDSDLAVILPEEIEQGKKFKLIFEYDGLEAFDTFGTGNYVLRARTNWYPNNTGSRFLDRATFDLKFRFPKEYVLVGVGELMEEKLDEGGYKYSHWSTKGIEMATAGFNFGDFRKLENKDSVSGYDLFVYTNKVLPEQMREYINRIEMIEAQRDKRGEGSLAINVGGTSTSAMAKTVMDEAQNSVRLYNAYFGKLPHKRISMTEQPFEGSGQAWATLVFMPYVTFISDTHKREFYGLRGAQSEFWREVGPHEVAHQWWGHSVGWTSYRDQWMSEGFAELSSSLYVQYVYHDTERFIRYWEDQRDLIVDKSGSTRGIKPYKVGPVIMGRRLFSSKAPGAYRRLVYPKGAFILHMLRMLMFDTKAKSLSEKDKRFREMLTDFIKTHYNKDVSTEDFKRIAEKHITPEMDLYKNGSLDWFFNEWVYGTEMPKYDFEYSVSGSGSSTVLSAKLTQSEVSDYFVMPVPIYVDYGEGWVELGKSIMVGNRSSEIKNVTLPKKPKRVAVAALQDVLASEINNKKLN